MRLQRPRKLQWLSLLLLLVNEVSGQLLSLLLLPALGIPNLTLCCAGHSSSLNHRCASRGSLPQSLLTACFVPKVSQWHVERLPDMARRVAPGWPQVRSPLLVCSLAHGAHWMWLLLI